MHKLYILFVSLLCTQYTVKAQMIFSENFENQLLSPAWTIVSGNWHIADVSELRIAPAENGYQYVLSSGGTGYISVIIDIPDSIKASKVQLQFSIYTFSKGTGATAEVEFHRKDLKDGIKGKPWKADLPVKGRWIVYKKLLNIPAGADAVYITFFAKKTPSSLSKPVCIDDLRLTAFR